VSQTVAGRVMPMIVVASTNGNDTEVTVTFEDVEEGTQVLVHVSLPDAPAAERHERGWTSILAKCRDQLESARPQSPLVIKPNSVPIIVLLRQRSAWRRRENPVQ
jgi:hypothetical protein